MEGAGAGTSPAVDRAQLDAALRQEIQRVWDEKFRVCGSEKVWRQLGREAIVVADLTYVAMWGGFVYVAFSSACFARCIAGWRVAASLRTDLTLEALEQALHARPYRDGLVYHSDHGVQHLAPAAPNPWPMRGSRRPSDRSAIRMTAPSPNLARHGFRGAVRGRAFTITTVREDGTMRPADLVRRTFHGDASERALGN